MHFLLPTLALLTSALAATVPNNPDSSAGKTLYVTSPSCTFYQCTITWHHGDTVSVNWLGPPEGLVSVSLASNIGGPTYPIVTSYPAISQAGYCDAGLGVGVVIPGVQCGMVQFVVPAGWAVSTNNTIVVQSLSTSTYVGYTDAIVIAASNTTVPGPAGTSVALLTIPAPTSTNLAGSTVFAGSLPVPTAITDAVILPSSSAAPVSAGVTSIKSSSSSELGISAGARASTSAASVGTSSAASANATTAVKSAAARGSARSAVVGILVAAGVWACLL